jgi:hypothetical protein
MTSGQFFPKFDLHNSENKILKAFIRAAIFCCVVPTLRCWVHGGSKALSGIEGAGM